MRLSRYKQLNDAQRQAITAKGADVVVRAELNPYTGHAKNLPHFQEARLSFECIVQGWTTAEAWVLAFVSWSNNPKRNSPRAFRTAQSAFKNGFAAFVEATNRRALKLSEFDSAVIDEYEVWTKNRRVPEGYAGAGGLTSPNTQRKEFALVKALFHELGKQPSTRSALAPGLTFREKRFPRAHASTIPTPVLDDMTWLQLIAACRKEVAETMREVRLDWAILDGPKAEPDMACVYRGRYANYAAALQALASAYPGPVPTIDAVRSSNAPLGDAVQHIHGYGRISKPLYPSAEMLLPFILLVTAYTQANTGPMRGLRRHQVEVRSVMERDRTVITFTKNRGNTQYSRSFAVDESDPFSPLELFRFVERWTARIRRFAEDHVDSVFIFVTNRHLVRAFLTAQVDGKDSDVAWRYALMKFCERNGLPYTTVSELRMTGLDIIRSLNRDDIRAVQAAGGQSAQGTIDVHYDGAGAKRRRQENLAGVMVVQERWAATGGRSDIRGAPDDCDIGAATPGWSCLDPFDSPIAGEIKGRPCQAYGRCPDCPAGGINERSPYVLARVLQLTAEVEKAQSYLDAQRWLAVYAQVLKLLRSKWIPQFTDPTVIAAAAQLNLSPIGRVE